MVCFQFSGFGCLFFQANRQASEQNFLRLPLLFCTTSFPHSGQKPMAMASRKSSWLSISVAARSVPPVNSFTLPPPFHGYIHICCDLLSHFAPYSKFAEYRLFLTKNIKKHPKNAEVFLRVFAGNPSKPLGNHKGFARCIRYTPDFSKLSRNG